MQVNNNTLEYLYNKYVRNLTTKNINEEEIEKLNSEEVLYIYSSINNLAKEIVFQFPPSERQEVATNFMPIIQQWKYYSLQKAITEGFYVMISLGTNLPVILSVDFKIFAFTDRKDGVAVAQGLNNNIKGIGCEIVRVGGGEPAIRFVHSMINSYGYECIVFNEGLFNDSNKNPLFFGSYDKEFINKVCSAQLIYDEFEGNRILWNASILAAQESYIKYNEGSKRTIDDSFHKTIINFYKSLIVSKVAIPITPDKDFMQIQLENGIIIIPVFSSKENMLRAMNDNPNFKYVEISGAHLLDILNDDKNPPLILDFNKTRLPIIKDNLQEALNIVIEMKRRADSNH